MFLPPFCPNPACRSFAEPAPGFFVRAGRYQPHCRAHAVPRFRCRSCGRRFSRQSFRADWRQKKPHLNATLLRLIVSCVGQRQAARALGVARRTVERRVRWLAAHALAFQEQGLRNAVLEGPFQLDEMESFEANRYQPVTVPVLIDRKTFFIVSTAVGPLRRKGRLTTHQRSRRAEHEAVHGRRRSGSLRAVRRVLSRLIPLTANQPVVLESDHKQLYGRLGLKMFGSRFAWRTHSATARRDRGNPLFPINHTNARLRHFLARLRRRTWCVSKSRFALQEHLQIVVLWANWCRGITNRTRITPAQALGVATRPYRPEELMAWRELWPVPTPTPRSSGIFI
jgi:transposase-like protein